MTNPLRHFINTNNYDKKLTTAKTFIQGKRKILRDNIGKNYKCSHCGQELGQITADRDEYDLMKSHIYSCPGKAAKAFRKAKDDESRGFGHQEW